MTHTGTFGRTLRTVFMIGALGAVAIWGLPAVFAAANTVSTSRAGDGTSTVSGYTASSIDYTLNATNPQNIDQVVFSLNTAPTAGSTIKVRLVSTGSTWYTCTNVTTAVTCVTTSPQATVASADELRLVIAD